MISMKNADGTPAVDLPDGVYIGLDEDHYHLLQRFSNSGVHNIRISEMDFWAESWMNTRKKRNDDDTYAKLSGRAFHARLCEGKEAFGKRYCYALDPADHKDALITNSQIKAELKSNGVKGYSDKDKAGLIALIKEYQIDVPIWEDLVSEHAKANEGKTILPLDLQFEIEFAVSMVEKNPHLAPAFTGGAAEVTVLWTKEVEDTGGTGEIFRVPMKSRLDYSKFVTGKQQFLTGVDLKTFANALGKPIHKAIMSQASNDKHHIQVAVYFEALEELIKAIGLGNCYDSAGVPLSEHPFVGVRPEADCRLLFVYQQRGNAPVARGRLWPRNMRMVDIGKIELRDASVKFAKCMKAYGDLPWVVPEEIKEMDDDEFSPWASE